MAGSCTTTYSTEGKYHIYVWSWTSHTDGSVGSVGSLANISGKIVGAKYVPGTGDDQPTDQYDVTLLDGAGNDVLGGTGANLSNVNTSQAAPAIGTYFQRVLINATLVPTVANAGSENKGTITLVVEGA